ncbi:hypothetical protein [Methyloligella solikamskensis]|uniref:Uncharacterized protein n=1 Tax=Methyloligella solikamskensis TaxID=1177756 RepID=A0ABW3JCD0_9HYPH
MSDMSETSSRPTLIYPMGKTRQVEIAADEEWRERLPVPLSLVVTVICLPLMLRYRLFRNGKPETAVQPAAHGR